MSKNPYSPISPQNHIRNIASPLYNVKSPTRVGGYLDSLEPYKLEEPTNQPALNKSKGIGVPDFFPLKKGCIEERPENFHRKNLMCPINNFRPYQTARIQIGLLEKKVKEGTRKIQQLKTELREKKLREDELKRSQPVFCYPDLKFQKKNDSSWIIRLRGSEPISEIAKILPKRSFETGFTLLEDLAKHRVPLIRAIWNIKAVYLYNNFNSKEKKTNEEWTKILIKYMFELLKKIKNSKSIQNNSTLKQRWIYGVRMSLWCYNYSMLKIDSFLTYLSRLLSHTSDDIETLSAKLFFIFNFIEAFCSTYFHLRELLGIFETKMKDIQTKKMKEDPRYYLIYDKFVILLKYIISNAPDAMILTKVPKLLTFKNYIINHSRNKILKYSQNVSSTTNKNNGNNNNNNNNQNNNSNTNNTNGSSRDNSNKNTTTTTANNNSNNNSNISSNNQINNNSSNNNNNDDLTKKRNNFQNKLTEIDPFNLWPHLEDEEITTKIGLSNFSKILKRSEFLYQHIDPQSRDSINVIQGLDKLALHEKIENKTIYENTKLNKKEFVFTVCEWATTLHRDFLYTKLFSIYILKTYGQYLTQSNKITKIAMELKDILIEFLFNFKSINDPKKKKLLIEFYSELIKFGLFSHDMYARKLIVRGYFFNDYLIEQEKRAFQIEIYSKLIVYSKDMKHETNQRNKLLYGKNANEKVLEEKKKLESGDFSVNITYAMNIHEATQNLSNLNDDIIWLFYHTQGFEKQLFKLVKRYEYSFAPQNKIEKIVQALLAKQKVLRTEQRFLSLAKHFSNFITAFFWRLRNVEKISQLIQKLTQLNFVNRPLQLELVKINKKINATKQTLTTQLDFKRSLNLRSVPKKESQIQVRHLNWEFIKKKEKYQDGKDKYLNALFNTKRTELTLYLIKQFSKFLLLGDGDPVLCSSLLLEIMLKNTSTLLLDQHFLSNLKTFLINNVQKISNPVNVIIFFFLICQTNCIRIDDLVGRVLFNCIENKMKQINNPKKFNEEIIIFCIQAITILLSNECEFYHDQLSNVVTNMDFMINQVSIEIIFQILKTFQNYLGNEKIIQKSNIHSTLDLALSTICKQPLIRKYCLKLSFNNLALYDDFKKLSSQKSQLSLLLKLYPFESLQLENNLKDNIKTILMNINSWTIHFSSLGLNILINSNNVQYEEITYFLINTIINRLMKEPSLSGIFKRLILQVTSNIKNETINQISKLFQDLNLFKGKRFKESLIIINSLIDLFTTLFRTVSISSQKLNSIFDQLKQLMNNTNINTKKKVATNNNTNANTNKNTNSNSNTGGDGNQINTSTNNNPNKMEIENEKDNEIKTNDKDEKKKKSLKEEEDFDHFVSSVFLRVRLLNCCRSSFNDQSKCSNFCKIIIDLRSVLCQYEIKCFQCPDLATYLFDIFSFFILEIKSKQNKFFFIWNHLEKSNLTPKLKKKFRNAIPYFKYYTTTNGISQDKNLSSKQLFTRSQSQRSNIRQGKVSYSIKLETPSLNNPCLIDYWTILEGYNETFLSPLVVGGRRIVKRRRTRTRK
ncbi:mediator of RNA polymerase ii transcription subunit 12 [Anaeramoeba flamelloides]|uniref:Mediator of RNA polymerase ii transcription subunit 12 n=1 Tax=Anaeramoeba flamelloides TaxID=1746091 RepID=A0ABQ8Y226_9EUKA|nr:mediator of RNA polymerase ii transcription subunit 12 [Anaeramoeba flamelloides]